MVPFLQVHQTQYLQTAYLVIAMFVLLGVLLSVVLFMLVFLLQKKKVEKQKGRWQQHVDLQIRRAVFFDDDPDTTARTGQADSGPTPANLQLIPITPRVQRWLLKPVFRQFLLDEMIEAKKNFSGNAAENLVKLCNQLHLEKGSLTKLTSLKWHIKARGIQELALMDQKEWVGKIYRLTNNPNEFVRMEAQSAIVHFYGFEGLRFLDVVTQPISEWQQIKLLAQLPKASSVLPEGMRGWLKSANASVVLFSLKLARIHHRFELHDPVATCLEHRDPLVRIQAVKCLQDICNETTSKEICRFYEQNDRLYRLATLEALQIIGSEQDVEFLKKKLLSDDHAIKLAAARALAAISETGMQWLESFEQAGDYPWNEIIRQAKNEKAA